MGKGFLKENKIAPDKKGYAETNNLKIDFTDIRVELYTERTRLFPSS
ncbi:MAG TPA: hypothetical protein VK102_05800 [Sphingobacterium sp.]|nr:hypothetical protein [Sphingobacterium sp.]